MNTDIDGMYDIPYRGVVTEVHSDPNTFGARVTVRTDAPAYLQWSGAVYLPGGTAPQVGDTALLMFERPPQEQGEGAR